MICHLNYQQTSIEDRNSFFYFLYHIHNYLIDNFILYLYLFNNFVETSYIKTEKYIHLNIPSYLRLQWSAFQLCCYFVLASWSDYGIGKLRTLQSDWLRNRSLGEFQNDRYFLWKNPVCRLRNQLESADITKYNPFHKSKVRSA